MSNELLGLQVKQLLSGVSDHGIAHLQEIEEDLIQITLLLSHAIKDLGSSFLELHSSIKVQENLIKENLDTNALLENSAHQFEQINRDIETHINEAVRNLQFQDLTSQLITRTVQRSTGLRELLATMNLVGNEIPHKAGNEEIFILLKDVSKKLQIQSLELKSQLRKTVSQQDLGSGEVELF